MDFNNLPKFVISLQGRLDRRIKFEQEVSREKVEFTIGYPGVWVGNSKKQRQQGCRLAHKEIIEKTVEAKGEHVCILEDDAVFLLGIVEKFNEWFKEVPDDWDMLYLGANNHRPLMMVSEHVGKCIYSLSTVGYIVRNTVYELLIKELGKDMILDMIYATVIQPKINCYCFKPNLVTQASGYSDIMGRYMDYTKYYEK